MENHGLLSVGRTMAEAFYFLYTLESACKVQVDVMTCGTDLIMPNKEAIDLLSNYGQAPADQPLHIADMAWQGCIAIG